MNLKDVADLSTVSPQQTFLISQPEKPSATSTLYIKRYTTKNNDETESHMVVGVHVVLANDEPNGIWKALHVDRAKQKLDPQNPRVATKSLQIYCDTLEVRGEFSLPEAEVVVYARRINWATADAAINTSPLSWAIDKAKSAEGTTPGKNGAHGRNAGSLKVFAAKIEPTGDTRPRLVAAGGNGQHPGSGLDGSKGKSMEHWTQRLFHISRKGDGMSKCTVDFNPAAVYVDYEWRWAKVWVGDGKMGDNSWPENGTNAVAAGVPGDAGDGGGLTTNVEAVKRSFTNAGGTAGDKQRDYSGGAAGTPTSAGKYKLTMAYNWFGTDNADKDLTKTDSHNTTPGTDSKSAGPAKAKGNTPAPVVIAAPNAWVHPLGLQKALEYTRDLFLGGGREECEAMLADYATALAQDPPPQTGVWDAASEVQWTAAQSEVASMLTRLRGHLDYFGNAPGYTPLLSLPASVNLYANESGRALKLLLLAGWVDAEERNAKEAAAALGDAIDAANKETMQAAEQITTGEAKVDSAASSIASIKSQLETLAGELNTLRNSLLTKAKNDLNRIAYIKAGIKMAATVCQIIPVGQPVLGTIGKLGDVAASFVGGKDDDIPDTVSKMGGVLTKAAEAAKKAKEAKEKAAAKRKKEPPKDKEEAKKEGTDWIKVGKGLGTAVSGVADAMKELQVSEDEIEAELQRLESDSPEWKALTKKIRDLNKRKADFASQLVEALQSVADGYARIAASADASFHMYQERGRQVGRLDPVATGVVREMGQRSRLALLKYLYLLVKSYETTLFSTLAVDWKLTAVTDKITALLKPDAGFDASKLNDYVTALAPLYEGNLNTVRASLITDFKISQDTLTLQLGLDSEQTPEVIADLNRKGKIVIDPVAYGILLTDRHLARLSNVQLSKLEFDPNGPKLTSMQNVIVTLRPAHTGTVRKGQQLYAVYSDEPLNWSWTMPGGQIKAGKRSDAAEDVLDYILGKGGDKIRQKVATPPVWSDLNVSVMYTPQLTPEETPRLTRLYFLFDCDVPFAPDNQRVLNVRSLGAMPGAVITCTPDLAKRADGFNQMLRIYDQGTNVTLSVPDHVGGAVFDSWDLIAGHSSQKGLKKREVKATLDEHCLAQCHWNPLQGAAEPIIKQVKIRESDRLELMRAVSERKDLAEESALREFIEAAAGESAPTPRDLPILIEPTVGSAVIGVAPTLEEATMLEERTRWKRINYRGIVGWVDVDAK